MGAEFAQRREPCICLTTTTQGRTGFILLCIVAVWLFGKKAKVGDNEIFFWGGTKISAAIKMSAFEKCAKASCLWAKENV